MPLEHEPAMEVRRREDVAVVDREHEDLAGRDRFEYLSGELGRPEPRQGAPVAQLRSGEACGGAARPSRGMAHRPQ
jgi:hypothetical protein